MVHRPSTYRGLVPGGRHGNFCQLGLGSTPKGDDLDSVVAGDPASEEIKGFFPQTYVMDVATRQSKGTSVGGLDTTTGQTNTALSVVYRYMDIYWEDMRTGQSAHDVFLRNRSIA